MVTLIDRSKDVGENDENGEDYSEKWDSKYLMFWRGGMEAEGRAKFGHVMY